MIFINPMSKALPSVAFSERSSKGERTLGAAADAAAQSA